MAHGIDEANAGLAPGGHPVVATLQHLLQRINRLVMVPCMVAVFLAAAILTYSVAARYFFKTPTEWQDETAVFLLMGTIFFSGAYVQSFRGHVGVEAVASLLSPRMNHWRMLFVEFFSLAFCAFFSWKSWTLFMEAVHEGFRSNSTWGPPLWIPYSLMSCGMTLLSIQLLLEVMVRLTHKDATP